MLGGIFAYVLCDTHGAEVRGLGAFGGQGLTKLMPIIFALAGCP
jgi:hypothetical protein